MDISRCTVWICSCESQDTHNLGKRACSSEIRLWSSVKAVRSLNLWAMSPNLWVVWYKDMKALGWGDGSLVKSTDCSSRAPQFNSQQPTVTHNHLQWDLMPFYGVSEARNIVLTYIKSLIYKKWKHVYCRRLSGESTGPSGQGQGTGHAERETGCGERQKEEVWERFVLLVCFCLPLYVRSTWMSISVPHYTIILTTFPRL